MQDRHPPLHPPREELASRALARLRLGRRHLGTVNTEAARVVWDLLTLGVTRSRLDALDGLLASGVAHLEVLQGISVELRELHDLEPTSHTLEEPEEPTQELLEALRDAEEVAHG